MEKRSIETAAEQLAVLLNSGIQESLERANEAETRLRLIDKILALLGWSEEEYKPEQVTSTGEYTDYRLTVNDQEKLIVEAKKFHRVEPFRKDLQKRQEFTNSFLFRSCGKELHDLLQQSKDYCADTGISYAVATDGDMWIVLAAPKPNVAWGSMKAKIFHSLYDISSRFSDFYTLLSRDSVKNNSLVEEFASQVVGPPVTLTTPRDHVRFEATLGEGSERQAISTYFDAFMDEIISNTRREILESCYVENPRLNEYTRDLQQLLDYNAIIDEQDFAIHEVSDEKLANRMKDQLKLSHPKTILLVGHVGAGKSTFIHRFNRHSAATGKGDICIVVDLINLSTVKVSGDEHDVQKLAKLVLDHLHNRFKSRSDPYDPAVIKRCFKQDLEIFRLQSSILLDQDREAYHRAEEEERKRLTSDSYKHLVCYLKFSRYTKNSRVWIAFDNVDQGSEFYQSFVYSFAQRLSIDSHCLTLITLREDTYLNARETGFLDVRSDTVLRVNAPELSQVLAKRRKYVEYLIDSGRLPSDLKHFIPQFQALHWHLNQLFLQVPGEVRLMVTSLSLSNIRFSLAMIRDYYSSYHSSLHERFATSLREDGYGEFNFSREMIRFVQTVMLGSSWVYAEASSLVFNVFAIEQRQRPTHFLCLKLLAYLDMGRGEQTKRLTRCRELINEFVSIGYIRSQVDAGIRRMLQHRLIVSPTYPSGYVKERSIELPDVLDENTRILLTPKGYYYLAYLSSNPYYQARVAEDTAWMDEDKALEYTKCLEESARSQSSFGAEDALMATKARDLFLSYLKHCWADELHSLGFPQDPRHWSYRINEVVEGYIFGQDRVLRTRRSQPSRRQPALPVETAGHIEDAMSISQIDGQQLPLLDLAQIRADDVYRQAADRLGPVPHASYLGATYPLKILWVLELASMVGLEALSATDIAEVLKTYTTLVFHPTNLYRFFRTNGQRVEIRSLWIEEPQLRYTISEDGRNVLRSYLATPSE